MDNMKQFNSIPDDNWRTQNFRQTVVAKIDEVIQRSGMQVARNSSDMENHVFMKAKTREEYMNMVAKLILHVREMTQAKANQNAMNMQGPGNQAGPGGPIQSQPPQGPGNPPGIAPDPINALQNLASQGSRNQIMNMGPQGQMQSLGPNPAMGGMQNQMGQQGPMASQVGPQGQTATNLLQTLNQRPQLSMQLQNKLSAGMGMGQGQIMGMGNPMGSQLQSQLAGPSMQGPSMQGPSMQGPNMQGPLMQNMQMGNAMQVPMSAANSMGPLQCNQVSMGPMGPNSMQPQMPGQMMGSMGGNQMVSMGMLQHMAGRGPPKEYARAPPPAQFLRQSPSPSAQSPAMGPSPASMGVMGGAMPSPMSMGALGPCGVGSPSAAPMGHLAHHQQRGVAVGMAPSPSALNTPGGVASPGGEEAAYRDKVRQLSKYIEPLKRMVHRMTSEGENMEKLTKMKNLLDILSNPNKRMPLDTLMKCEVVLEKLDFKRSEGVGLGLPTSGKEQIYNPLLEVVSNCLQSPLANHTLKRTFGTTLDALNGPEIKNLPPSFKMPKLEELTCEIPDELQGEIARLDSRFKVSLDPVQSGGGGDIRLIAQLDDPRLPSIPPVRIVATRGGPARLRPGPAHKPAGDLLARVDKALEARLARLPDSCSVSQLLDAWEMSVRQACAPPAATPANYTPVPALGL